MSNLRRRLILALLALGIALIGGAWLKARQRPPDIIVVVGDSLRADRVGGDARPSLTPFLDQLAAGGVRFTRAYATSSWTLPSIASLVTSRYPSQHGVNSHEAKLRDEEITINERLREVGYTQLGFTANFRLDEAGGFAQGYSWWFPSVGESGDPPPKPGAGRIAREAMAFVDDVVFSTWRKLLPRSPFLFYFHFMEPHAPYLPPDADVARLGIPPAQVRSLNQQLLRIQWKMLGKPQVAALAALYDAEVASLDAALRDLFAAASPSADFLTTPSSSSPPITARNSASTDGWGMASASTTRCCTFPSWCWRRAPPRGRRSRRRSRCSTSRRPFSIYWGCHPSRASSAARAPPGCATEQPAAMTCWRSCCRSGTRRTTPRSIAPRCSAGPAKVILHRVKPARPDPLREVYDLAADPREQHRVPFDSGLAEALDQRVAELSVAAPPPAARALDEVTRERLRALGYAIDAEPAP